MAAALPGRRPSARQHPQAEGQSTVLFTRQGRVRRGVRNFSPASKASSCLMGVRACRWRSILHRASTSGLEPLLRTTRPNAHVAPGLRRCRSAVSANRQRFPTSHLPATSHSKNAIGELSKAGGQLDLSAAELCAGRFRPLTRRRAGDWTPSDTCRECSASSSCRSRPIC